MAEFFIGWGQNFAQNPVYTQYTEDNGLPSSEVYYITQDSKGYIWLATSNGVSRFNGEYFQNFGLEDNLPDLTVFTIYEDHKGRLWFVSMSGMLSYYKNGQLYSYKYNDIIRRNISGEFLPIKNGLFVDSEESVFISLEQYGILKVDSKGNTEQIKYEKPCALSGFITINDSVEMFARGSKIEALHCDTMYTNFVEGYGIGAVFDHQSNVHLSSKFRQYHIKHNDIFYTSYFNAISKVSTHKAQNALLPSTIITINTDRQNNIWVGVSNDGVYVFENGNIDEEYKQKFFKGESINHVFNDHEGGYWFATYGNGIYYVPSLDVMSMQFPDDVSNLNTLKTIIYKNNIYTISNNNKVYMGAKGIIDKKILGIDKNWYFLSASEINNKLYFGLSEGFLTADNPMLRVKSRTVGSCLSFLHDHGKLYIGTGDGMIEIDDKEDFNYQKHEGFKKRVNDIAKYKDEIILACTDGLWKYHNGKFMFMGEEHEQLRNRIIAIDVNKENDFVALASKGRGLFIINGDSIIQISEREGLLNNYVTSVKIRNDTIWAGTKNGLNKIVFDPNEGNYSIKQITQNHGLLSNVINHLNIHNDTIYVATNKGVCYFSTSQKLLNDNRPPVYISNIAINGSDTLLKDSYSLNYKQNRIRVDFHGLNYKSQGKVLYLYKIEELDNVWNESRNNTIQLSLLKPGRYTFSVLAVNEDGISSVTPAKVSFLIYPPFWKTWWFVSICMLLVVALFVYYFYSRFSRMRKKEEMNNKLIRIQQKALGSQMNPHFIFNSLNSIQYYILNNDKVSSQRYLGEFAKLMRIVLENSQKHTISLSEELNAIENYLKLEELRFRQSFTWHVKIEKGINIHNIKIPPLLLQPFIENAIWHGFSKRDRENKLQISINKAENGVLIGIDDNGIGRQQAHLMKQGRKPGHKSLGVDITQQRIGLFNALYKLNIDVDYIDKTDDGGNPVGTLVRFYLPDISK